MAEGVVLARQENITSTDFENALEDLEGFAKEPKDSTAHPTIEDLVKRLSSLGRYPELYK